LAKGEGAGETGGGECPGTAHMVHNETPQAQSGAANGEGTSLPQTGGVLQRKAPVKIN